MESVHKLNRSRSMYRMVVIGCGGTGSALIGGLPFLHQALAATGHPGLQVVVADGDRVSASNCVRQPFSESEIGLYKSTVLVNRLNLFWGLNWQACTEYATRKTEGKADILISCVDTRSARFEIIQSPLFRNCAYWLDLGNTADGGQFVLGQLRNSRNCRTRHRLPTVVELFPLCFAHHKGNYVALKFMWRRVRCTAGEHTNARTTPHKLCYSERRKPIIDGSSRQRFPRGDWA